MCVIMAGDYADRLKNAGFDVLIIPKDDLLEPDEQARMSLDLENEVILCRKQEIIAGFEYPCAEFVER